MLKILQIIFSIIAAAIAGYGLFTDFLCLFKLNLKCTQSGVELSLLNVVNPHFSDATPIKKIKIFYFNSVLNNK